MKIDFGANGFIVLIFSDFS
uniref:Uncharacterized protein n=1 Tax=Arundo donax TaxID=35708 RepID=A0A0A8Y1U4_ARUDO